VLRRLWGLLGCLLLGVVPAGGQAAAGPVTAGDGQPASIIVVLDDNYPPYIFKDEAGHLRGILVDQWAAWERATGVRVDLRGLDWAEALRQMSSGEADVIDTIFKTAEREAAFDFTAPYVKLEVPVFFHKGITGIATPEDLRGFRVAVKAGDACAAVLQSHGVTDLQYYPSYAAIVEAAVSGRERIFSIDRPPAIYLLTKAGAETEFLESFSLYSGEFHRAVAQGDGATLALVERGFAAIPAAELRSIDERWLGRPIFARVDPRFMTALVALAMVALIFAFNLLFMNWVLRRRVARRTAELAGKVVELQASKAKVNAILKALPDLLFVFDREGRFVESHVGGSSELAAPPEIFLGRTVGDVFGDKELDSRTKDAIDKALAGDGVQSIVYQLAMPSGPRSNEARLVALSDEAVLCVARDITEKVRGDELVAASLREKETLLKEIHHRVKNNLQIVSSLLSIQADRIRDDFDRSLLLESQSRVNAMAQVHEQLYRSSDLSSIPVKEYLTEMLGQLESAWGQASHPPTFSIETDGLTLELERAVPLGLIVNELATNAYKYAFPGKDDGHLTVTVGRESQGEVLMRVLDNGPGFAEGFSMEVSAGMGYTIVRALVGQLSGTMTAGNGPAGGLQVEIRLPAKL